MRVSGKDKVPKIVHHEFDRTFESTLQYIMICIFTCILLAGFRALSSEYGFTQTATCF